MKNVIALLVGLVISGAVGAAISSDGICGGLTERDGISCTVKYVEGSGNTLYVRINVKKADGQDRVSAAKAATRRVVDAFLQSGGIFIEMRQKRADGVEIERYCSKVKGRKTEHCEPWVPVKG